ncbi:ommochrome-binding protein-like [Cydia pomonella]|uniref:ommochrome-binding protein-like n=1 Tax=Cydia pomonella TaxID=82600 RepID=UPI002ADD58F5|nr:ommochrome-binding protein-like [Cydia pomonella]
MDLCNNARKFTNMQIPILICLILIPLPVQNIEYYKTYYTKEVLLLWNRSGMKPCCLNVHKYTNTLFFCFSRPQNFDSQVAFLNMDTKETETITGIKKGCANTVDQENDIVYLGGSKGIYKYNMETKKPEFYAEKDVHIKSLFYKERLYYIRHPDKKVFIEHEGQFAHISEFMDLKIDHFLVSREGIVYFTVKNNIYIYDKNETQWDLKGLRKAHTVNAMAEDNNGIVYLGTDRGVFTVVKNGLQKFMNEKNIVGITTDKQDNLIFADNFSIFRLLRNEK